MYMEPELNAVLEIWYRLHLWEKCIELSLPRTVIFPNAGDTYVTTLLFKIVCLGSTSMIRRIPGHLLGVLPCIIQNIFNVGQHSILHFICYEWAISVSFTYVEPLHTLLFSFFIWPSPEGFRYWCFVYWYNFHFMFFPYSTLSKCGHAVVATLYPFTWQHTYIPVLPASMIDIVCSPTPFLIGILSCSLTHLQDLPIEEVRSVKPECRAFLPCCMAAKGYGNDCITYI